MKTDLEIRGQVRDELRWLPDLEDSDLDVEVSGGVVTLSGVVPSYNDRFHAEAAVKRVDGVCGVANEIVVSTRAEEKRADATIARRAIETLRTEMPKLAANVQVVVSAAHLTLEGSVEFEWQRQQLESVARATHGVTVVTNLLVVRPRDPAWNIKQLIGEAFLLEAESNAQQVSVETHGGALTLRGRVNSNHAKQQAERVAGTAPGIHRVNNEIQVTG